ncbi:MAG: beta-galactosidase [Chloroflexi bacterium]|nr:beta-galactosidase [Chloroflexota bacterium]
MRRPLVAAALATAALAPILSELRVARPVQPRTDTWQTLPIQPPGTARLGLNVRLPQVDAMGLDPHAALQRLLDYPFELLRLGAYWSRLEPAPGQFVPDELDRFLDAAERAGKQVWLALGAVKTFGYPEFFVPAHRLPRPIREGVLVRADDHAWLLQPALDHLARLVERYRQRACIVGWQIEHEAVDPLGLEHSWRLAADFVAAEIATVRRADPARPILLNGFLPMSIPVAAQQWWRTRDQGDSLAFALDHADVVGLDVYPRHGLVSLGPLTVYLDGGRRPLERRLRTSLIDQARARGRRVMVSEGQAEPWETVVQPPDPASGVLYSCSPEQMLQTYNACLRWTPDLEAYLFWGAEYWLQREQSGDPSFLRAFGRVLDSRT